MELRGGGPALLDEPLRLAVRGVPPASSLVWRARLRDDTGRVWRAAADAADDLLDVPWSGKAEVAALSSLRPVALEVRAEAPDGAAATRVLDRVLVAAGVRVRRWRESGLAAVLHRPAGRPSATVLAPAADPTAGVAAALLASRGVLVVLVARGEDRARELLAAVPGAGAPERLAELPVPPGIPAREPAGRAASWDALLARLGARPRGSEAARDDVGGPEPG